MHMLPKTARVRAAGTLACMAGGLVLARGLSRSF
jgi:hypothetical protein